MVWYLVRKGLSFVYSGNKLGFYKLEKVFFFAGLKSLD